MYYVCYGCNEKLPAEKYEMMIPQYDAIGGSIDSFDVVCKDVSPLLDGLCIHCHVKMSENSTDVKSDDYYDDELPF